MALADLRRLAMRPVTHDPDRMGHTIERQKTAEIRVVVQPVTRLTHETPENDKGGTRSGAEHAAQMVGLRSAGLQRPPSWHAPSPHTPPAGAWCGTCRGQRWWSEDGRGWCCATCDKPPPALPGQRARFKEART